MDNFRALPKLNEKLEELIAKGELRLATVVASYGNEVEVTVTGGARARFPSTHIGVPVGQKGALLNAPGGTKVFTPMDIVIPQTLYGAWGGNPQTISTAGDYAKSGLSLTFTGLVPSRQYTVDVDVDIRCWATTGTASCYPGVIVEHAGGTSTITAILNPPILTTNRGQLTWSSAPRYFPKGDGTLTVKPGIKWYSGSISMTGASIKATIS